MLQMAEPHIIARELVMTRAPKELRCVPRVAKERALSCSQETDLRACRTLAEAHHADDGAHEHRDDLAACAAGRRQSSWCSVASQYWHESHAVPSLLRLSASRTHTRAGRPASAAERAPVSWPAWTRVEPNQSASAYEHRNAPCAVPSVAPYSAPCALPIRVGSASACGAARSVGGRRRIPVALSCILHSAPSFPHGVRDSACCTLVDAVQVLSVAAVLGLAQAWAAAACAFHTPDQPAGSSWCSSPVWVCVPCMICTSLARG